MDHPHFRLHLGLRFTNSPYDRFPSEPIQLNDQHVSESTPPFNALVLMMLRPSTSLGPANDTSPPSSDSGSSSSASISRSPSKVRYLPLTQTCIDAHQSSSPPSSTSKPESDSPLTRTAKLIASGKGLSSYHLALSVDRGVSQSRTSSSSPEPASPPPPVSPISAPPRRGCTIIYRD